MSCMFTAYFICVFGYLFFHLFVDKMLGSFLFSRVIDTVYCVPFEFRTRFFWYATSGLKDRRIAYISSQSTVSPPRGSVKAMTLSWRRARSLHAACETDTALPRWIIYLPNLHMRETLKDCTAGLAGLLKT